MDDRMEGSEDRKWMKLALALARRAKGNTFPNPAVGAVVVSHNRVVGTGMTAPAGGPHAEVRALRRAGREAVGATLYVTLEPCCHHGRTGPCTAAIIEAGVRRVVAAVRDPNPLVNGKGLNALRRFGIATKVGVCHEEAVRLNEDFFWWITKRKPWVSLKMAMTLDGRIADRWGQSRWITSEASRRFVHELRRTHAAVAVGRNTLLRDNPELTVRHVRGRSPVRIVFGRGPIPARTTFVKTAHSVRSIVVRPGGVEGRVRKLPSGLEEWQTGATKPSDVLQTFCNMAYAQGLVSILVEGGQHLAASFLEAQAVNRVYLFYAPKLLGQGTHGLLFGRGLPLGRCIRLVSVENMRFGDDILVSGVVHYPHG